MALDHEAALEDIDHVLAMIQEIEDDYPRIWDRGESFLEDVREKISEVNDTITEMGMVTQRQQTAIDNWAKGVSRWHPDHR